MNGHSPYLLAALVALIPVGAAARAPASREAAADVLTPAVSELSSDVVFSVSKRLQLTQEAPAIVRVFTREEIERGGFRNLNELLATIPEIEVIDTQRHQYLIIKGVPLTILGLLNGTTVVNHGDNFVGLDRLVPIEIVEKVEVVLSPGGVLWGAHAVYGIVNVITRAAAQQEVQRVSLTTGWWSTVRTAYGLSSRIGDLRWQLHGSVETSRGPTVFVEDSELQPGVYGNRGDTENDVGLALHLFGSMAWRGFFVDVLAHVIDDHTYPWSEITGARARAGYNSHSRRPTYTATLGYQRGIELRKLKLELLGKASLFDQPYSNLVYNYPPGARFEEGAHHTNTMDHQLRVSANLEAKASYWRCHSIVGWEGFRASIDDMLFSGLVNDEFNERVILPAATSYTMSLYAQQEIYPHRDVNLAAGMRWNLSDSYRPALLFHGHAVYEPIDNLFVKANFSEGFRPPSYDQRFMDNALQMGNEDLDPERSRTFEGQAEYLVSPWSGSRLRVVGGYTFSQLLDIIDVEEWNMAPVRYYRNLRSAHIHTVSASTRLELERWLRASIAYAHHFPSDSADGFKPRDFAHNRLSASLETNAYQPLTVVLRYGYTGSREIWYYIDPGTESPTTLSLDGYHELSLTARYRLWNTGLFVGATLRNLLFQDYDHTVPYNHMPYVYRGPFPQPHTTYGFVTLEWVRSM